MGVLGWVILGLVAGAIAEAVHRGDEPGGPRRSRSHGRRRAVT